MMARIHAIENGKESRRQRFSEWLTPKRVEMLEHLIQSVVGAIVGLMLTTLFSGAIVAVIVMSFWGDRSQSLQLLHTALTLAGSALGAVLGYFLGRRAKGKPQ
jgi:hypothetical protein